MSATIVLLHGLWMSGFELGVLKRRLEKSLEIPTATFSYPTMSGSMSNHVASLIEFARALPSDELHFVGHSLGGLVVLGALQVTDDLPPGRAVLLGSPVQGSRAAQGVARMLPFGKAILGATAHAELVDYSPREWSGRRDIGVIAGSMGMGLGRLFADFGSDHDGTVLVEETRLPGAKDQIVVSTSHTGLLFSAEAAMQTAYFIRHGMFNHAV